MARRGLQTYPAALEPRRIDGAGHSLGSSSALAEQDVQQDPRTRHWGQDELSRPVFGVLGLPLDALDLDTLLARIDAAVAARTPMLLSTPNVNFLMISRQDKDFRESLLISDLCPVDGMPLLWIARLLGVPISQRLSGSDIFAALKARSWHDPKVKVFLFGGSEGAAEIVRQSINTGTTGMLCVDAFNPGFGSIAEMSTPQILDRINSSHADLLTVFLSAGKAQTWLLQNGNRLQVPVRAQFGATINLQAGTITRAPVLLQRLGLEWLWRVKEEPYLWRRYWRDGSRLLFLMLTCVLPLSFGNWWRQATGLDRGGLCIERVEGIKSIHIAFKGAAVARHIDVAIVAFHQALSAEQTIVIDLSQTSTIDPRFFGLLLMVRKRLLSFGRQLQFANIPPRLSRIFALNGFEFLLAHDTSKCVLRTP